METEKRGGLPAEIRAEGGSIRVSGYAAVFNQPANIGGMFREVIRPGAFRNAIGRDDVAFLINHRDLPLARTRSGTLTLEEDSHGLRIDAELDATDPDVARILPKMKRGDLDKMSFAFSVPSGGQDWSYEDGMDLRTLTELNLSDVSIVTEPAYDGTSIALRSLDEARKEQRQKNFNAAAKRLAMKADLALRKRRESKA